MIKRIWHGWTSHDKANVYERLLRETIFPGIAAKGIAGYRDIQLLRRAHADEVEFVTIMTFDGWEGGETVRRRRYDGFLRAGRGA